MRKAGNLTMPLSRNLGTLTSWKPLGLSRSVTGLLYHLLARKLHTIAVVRGMAHAVSHSSLTAEVGVRSLADINIDYLNAKGTQTSNGSEGCYCNHQKCWNNINTIPFPTVSIVSSS